jgi:hypothetical protein
MVAGDTEALRCPALAVRESRRWMCCRRGAVGGPARPSVQPGGCNGNSLRVPDPVVEHVVSPLPSPRRSLPILWRRWRSAADAVSRRGAETPLQARTQLPRVAQEAPSCAHAHASSTRPADFWPAGTIAAPAAQPCRAAGKPRRSNRARGSGPRT